METKPLSEEKVEVVSVQESRSEIQKMDERGPFVEDTRNNELLQPGPFVDDVKNNELPGLASPSSQ